MFEPQPKPRLFAMPPGADFPRLLAEGLVARMAGQPPEAMARVEVYVNTRRMQRRLRDLLAANGARLLPRLRLITDLATDPVAGLPPAVPPLRRRLELAQAVARLLDAQPDLAPRAAIYDLADSLAKLLDEMQGEGVSPERIAALDVADHSRHWERSRTFLQALAPWFAAEAPDAEARQRMAVERLAARWSDAPPDHPILVAGSTGSRGATQAFLQAVARLPQGAVVLPGFDFDTPEEVWEGMTDATTAEDHPQFRFARLMQALDMAPGEVTLWDDAAAPCPARNRLISLALRPAPVTDRWMVEGPRLTGIETATAEMTLIEAPSPRAEALAIALILRRAVQDGQTAALITPDRMLTRQVTAALDRWGILPDDSAGKPLALSPPGRFLRQIVRLFGQRLTAERLIALLKHPLTHSGADRGPHLRLTRELELQIRRHGPAFPEAADLIRWAATRPEVEAPGWAAWLAAQLANLNQTATRPLAEHLADTLRLAEALAIGPSGAGTGELWLEEAGEAALATVAALVAEAGHGGDHTPADFADLFSAVIEAEQVRDPAQPHPGVMIWGTLETRVQGADLVILGGLNDGIWPQLPPPDPWLNRQMRLQCGLLLPERRVGLAAHDFQQAIAAPQVVLTRAIRDAEAQTVPSRWLNRLTNLLDGLPDQGGKAALKAMRARGREWLDLAAALDRPVVSVPPTRRPAPRPPVDARPRELPVTGISRLIRNPYEIYARYILRLRPLDPLHPDADARLRGTVLHKVFEAFQRADPPHDRARLMALAEAVLAAEVPWATARRLWLARLGRVADWYLAWEAEQDGQPVLIEDRGIAPLDGLDFRLTARPDRIDRLRDGSLHIIDYKTGTPPSKKQQQNFDKQLLLEAAMAERGAFPGIDRAPVAQVSYVGLGATPKIEELGTDEGDWNGAWAGLQRLIAAYEARSRGYTARRAMFGEREESDYDHLSRFGEWAISDDAAPEDVG